MPILIRPVREQIEHDRIIRVLQARLRKEFAVEANLGDERRVPVRVGEQLLYPDLVLTSSAASKKVQTIIEVETTESVNHLEAMAEWAHYGRARAPFHLYVPSGLVEIARRLIESYHISVAQLWSYSPVGDQVHFWLVSGDGSGTIVTSVTDSISSAEPVRPAIPAAEKDEAAAGSDERVTAPATPEKPKTEARPSREGKPAPAPKAEPKPAAVPAKPAAPAKPVAKAARPAPLAPPKPAAAKTAAKPVQKPAKVAAKASAQAAKPVARKPAATKPAAKPASKKAVAKPAAKKAAAKPAAKRAPAKPAAKRAAAKKPAHAGARPKARPAAGKAAKSKRR